jgi:hypothetical protein
MPGLAGKDPGGLVQASSMASLGEVHLRSGPNSLRPEEGPGPLAQGAPARPARGLQAAGLPRREAATPFGPWYNCFILWTTNRMKYNTTIAGLYMYCTI